MSKWFELVSQRPSRKKLVDDAMTKKLVTMQVDSTLEDALHLMDSGGIRHLPLVDGMGSLVGLISDRDILKHISPMIGTGAEESRDKATLKKPLRSIMSQRLITVIPQTTIPKALELMLQHRIHCLPVVNGSGTMKLVGMVTSTDFLKLLKEVEEELSRFEG